MSDQRQALGEFGKEKILAGQGKEGQALHRKNSQKIPEMSWVSCRQGWERWGKEIKGQSRPKALGSVLSTAQTGHSGTCLSSHHLTDGGLRITDQERPSSAILQVQAKLRPHKKNEGERIERECIWVRERPTWGRRETISLLSQPCALELTQGPGKAGTPERGETQCFPCHTLWAGHNTSVCVQTLMFIHFISKNTMQAGFIISQKQEYLTIKGSVSSERPVLSPGPRPWDLKHHSLISEDKERPSLSLEPLQSPELTAASSTLQASSRAPSTAAKTLREKLPYFLKRQIPQPEK